MPETAASIPSNQPLMSRGYGVREDPTKRRGCEIRGRGLWRRTMPRALLIAVAALLLVACASAVRLAPIASGSVADPHSPEPPPPAASQTLLPDASSKNTAAPVVPTEGTGHGATTHAGHQEDKSMSSPIVYTCPMHPEVRSDASGTCPKCGMKLVPMKPTPGPGSK